MSAEVLRLDLTILVFAKWVIAALMGIGGMVDFGVDALTETFMIAAVIVLEILSVSYVITLWVVLMIVVSDTDTSVAVLAGIMIDLLARTVAGVISVLGVDVLAGVDTNLHSATIPALEFIFMLSLSEEALCFGCEIFSCWTTADWKCCAPQA